MKLNISPNTVASKLISSLIKEKSRGKDNSQKEGVDLAGIAQKIFSHKRSQMEEEKKEMETVSNE
jgi:hypothetical protein